jgi:ubiquitin-protein ligase E3 A
MVSKPNTVVFLKFFNNYIQIINTAKLYLENDIENSSIIIEEEDKETTETKIKTNVNKGLYTAFAELKKYPDEFKDMIMRCHNFLALVLFSIDQSVPPENEEDEEPVNIIDEDMLKILEIFVPTLNIFHDVNENYSIVSYKVFYNDGISKSLNIRREFYNYLNNEKIKKRQKKEEEKAKAKEKEKGKKEDEKDKEEKNNDNIIIMDEEKDEEKEDEKLEKKNDKLKFTLFDYMWIFNPAAKNDIIRLFNMEQQKNMFFKMIDDSRRDRDDLGFLDFFLNRNKFNLMLNIRRDHLIEDTLNELSKPNVNLQSELKVKFSGEQGVDEGGVRKEFFILLIRQIFDPNYGMFSYNKKTRLYWFNHYSFEPKIKYELIGKIFGLAIYNNTILDVKLPIVVYKKLLGIKPNLDDMKECDPELYHTLNYLVNNNDPNLKEELDTNFTVIDDKFGEKLVIPLKPNGENILIDINNKNEYVELYLDWYFNKSIQEYFNSFEKGFYCVFNRNLSKVLTPDELELIICGTQILDFNELKKACQYEEYTKDSETIKYFWEILLDFNEEEKKKFLSFVTGCDRAPIDGLGSLRITISNGGTDIKQLPSAHTCFDNLILPDYKDKEKMKKAILTAINYSEGFGLI